MGAKDRLCHVATTVYVINTITKVVAPGEDCCARLKGWDGGRRESGGVLIFMTMPSDYGSVQCRRRTGLQTVPPEWLSIIVIVPGVSVHALRCGEEAVPPLYEKSAQPIYGD